MEKRQSVIEQFSSFVRWQTDNQFAGWQSDSRLRYRMEQLLSRDPSLESSQYWLIYWHRRYAKSIVPNAKLDQVSYNSLAAYLQESCYQAAFKVYSTYRLQIAQLTLCDYFSTACEQTERILRDFNPELNPNLEAYAYPLLHNRILDFLREFDKSLGSTQWALLLNASNRRLHKALERSGRKPEEHYFMVRNLYQQFGRSPQMKQNRKYEAPSPELLHKLLHEYNQISESKVNLEQIRDWLYEMAIAVKSYLSLSIQSSNRPISESGKVEWIDTFDDPTQSWDEQLNLDEQLKQYQSLADWLSQELDQINPSQHRLNPLIFEMLEGYYGQGLTQTQLAQTLGPNQSTVGRNLIKFTEVLASRFIPWAQTHFSAPISPEQMSSICGALEEWLRHYYQEKQSLPQEERR